MISNIAAITKRYTVFVSLTCPRKLTASLCHNRPAAQCHKQCDDNHPLPTSPAFYRPSYQHDGMAINWNVSPVALQYLQYKFIHPAVFTIQTAVYTYSTTVPLHHTHGTTAPYIWYHCTTHGTHRRNELCVEKVEHTLLHTRLLTPMHVKHTVPLLYVHHTVPFLYVHHTVPLRYVHHTVPLLYVHHTVPLPYVQYTVPLPYVQHTIPLPYVHHTVPLPIYNIPYRYHMYISYRYHMYIIPYRMYIIPYCYHMYNMPYRYRM
jgi:hypothetical protein